MKNAALILGIIGGILAAFVGFTVYGYVELMGWLGAETSVVEEGQVENPDRLKAVGLVAPLLAIAGGAMANLRPVPAGVLLAASSAGIFWGLGFNVFTMFPIAMTALAAFFALMGRATSEPGTME